MEERSSLDIITLSRDITRFTLMCVLQTNCHFFLSLIVIAVIIDIVAVGVVWLLALVHVIERTSNTHWADVEFWFVQNSRAPIYWRWSESKEHKHINHLYRVMRFQYQHMIDVYVRVYTDIANANYANVIAENLAYKLNALHKWIVHIKWIIWKGFPSILRSVTFHHAVARWKERKKNCYTFHFSLSFSLFVQHSENFHFFRYSREGKNAFVEFLLF